MSADETVSGACAGSGTWIWIKPAPPAPPLLLPLHPAGQQRGELAQPSTSCVGPVLSTGPAARTKSRRAPFTFVPPSVKSTAVADSRITCPPEPPPPVPPT